MLLEVHNTLLQFRHSVANNPFGALVVFNIVMQPHGCCVLASVSDDSRIDKPPVVRNLRFLNEPGVISTSKQFLAPMIVKLGVVCRLILHFVNLVIVPKWSNIVTACNSFSPQRHSTLQRVRGFSTGPRTTGGNVSNRFNMSTDVKPR